MAEKEYIEREKLNDMLEDFCVNESFYDALQTIPSADVSPVRHGRWDEIVTHNGCTPDYDCLCSMCKKSGMPTYYYCPHCGAKMDEKECEENEV